MCKRANISRNREYEPEIFSIDHVALFPKQKIFKYLQAMEIVQFLWDLILGSQYIVNNRKLRFLSWRINSNCKIERGDMGCRCSVWIDGRCLIMAIEKGLSIALSPRKRRRRMKANLSAERTQRCSEERS